MSPGSLFSFQLSRHQDSRSPVVQPGGSSKLVHNPLKTGEPFLSLTLPNPDSASVSGGKTQLQFIPLFVESTEWLTAVTQKIKTEVTRLAWKCLWSSFCDLPSLLSLHCLSQLGHEPLRSSVAHVLSVCSPRSRSL